MRNQWWRLRGEKAAVRAGCKKSRVNTPVNFLGGEDEVSTTLPECQRPVGIARTSNHGKKSGEAGSKVNYGLISSKYPGQISYCRAWQNLMVGGG